MQYNKQKVDNMADQTQTDGQVVINSTPLAGPGVYYSVPAAAAAPQTLYVSQHQKTTSGKYGASLDRVTSIWLGALLICSGVTSFVGAAFAFKYNAYYSELGTGLWCGAMFVSAGAVGIAAGIHGTDSLVKGIIPSSVLTVVFATTQLTMAALGLCHDEDGYKHGWEWQKYAIAANGMLTGSAIVAIIFSVWFFAIGCTAICRFKNSPQHSQWLASDRTADTNSLPTEEDSVHLKETAVSIHKNVVCLGVILLVCGVASQLGGVLGLKVYAAFAEIAFGLWGGALFFAVGAVAIAAGHHPTKKLITGTAAISAIAAAVAGLQVSFSGLGLHSDMLEYLTCNSMCHPDDDINCPCNYNNWEAIAIAANSTMIGAGTLAFIVSLWVLVLACIALCRKPSSVQPACDARSIEAPAANGFKL